MFYDVLSEHFGLPNLLDLNQEEHGELFDRTLVYLPYQGEKWWFLYFYYIKFHFDETRNKPQGFGDMFRSPESWKNSEYNSVLKTSRFNGYSLISSIIIAPNTAFEIKKSYIDYLIKIGVHVTEKDELSYGIYLYELLKIKVFYIRCILPADIADFIMNILIDVHY